MLIEPRGEQKDGVEAADAKRPRLRCCTHAGFRPRGRRLGCGFGCRRMTSGRRMRERPWRSMMLYWRESKARKGVGKYVALATGARFSS